MIRSAKIALLAACFLAAGCVKNPVTGEQDFVTISEEQEIRQGRNYHFQILKQYGVYEDREVQEYVNEIGQALAKKSHRSHLKYTFTVLDSPEINAFALPGGYIYITRGIMAYLNSEAELAGVLGHEIGHVTARHSVRQQSGQTATSMMSVLIAATTGNSALTDLSQQLGTGLIRGYGREHELEADRLGAEYLHKIGFDPDTMLEVIGVLKDQEVYERSRAKKEGREPRVYHGVYSTHPRNDARLKTVVRAARKLTAKDYRDPNEPAYLEIINGIAWDKNIRQGVITGNRFAHPDLGFTVDLPKQWDYQNQPDYLYVLPPERNGMIRIGADQLKDNETPAQMLRRITNSDKLRVNNESNGVSAALKVSTRNGEDPARIHLLELNNGKVLVLLAAAEENAFPAVKKAMDKMSGSFDRLNRQQVTEIKQPRIKIIRPKDGQNFESLAGSDFLGSDPVGRLRLLNRSYPDGNTGDLTRVKVIDVDG